MNRIKRMILIGGIGAALAGGLALPVAAWAKDGSPSPSASPSPGTPSDRPSDGPRGGHGGPGGFGDHGQMGAKLAELLGVDEAKVTAALDEIRKEDGTNGPPAEGGTDQADRQKKLAEALASKLGLTTDKVTTALETLQKQRQADAESGLTERLKAAVSSGTLTQAESDAVLKAFRAGVIGGGFGGGPGGPGRH